MGKTNEVESQFYLTTWAVDEARHTELFTRFYHRIAREPLSILRFPSGYRFQSAIVSKDAAEWLAGVLVSEVLAKKVMEEFRRLDLDPVLSEISQGILRDEARHLGFNHIYLEDRFSRYFGGHGDARAWSCHLHDRIEKVLAQVPPIFDALADEILAIGIDRDFLLDSVRREATERLEKAIEAGARIASRENAVAAQPVVAHG